MLLDYLKIVIIVSLIPVIMISLYISSKVDSDKPFAFIFHLFLRGILSCIPACILEMIFSYYYPNAPKDLTNLFIYTFFSVGIIEEFCKWINVVKESDDYTIDRIYDLVIYAVTVSLGFAFFENITYTLRFGITTEIIRDFLSVPGHAMFGAFMGYYLGMAKYHQGERHYIRFIIYGIFSLLIPALFHTTFDFILSVESNYVTIIFFVFLIIAYRIIIHKINSMASNNRRIRKRY